MKGKFLSDLRKTFEKFGPGYWPYYDEPNVTGREIEKWRIIKNSIQFYLCK